MSPKLTAISGPLTGSMFPLTHPGITLGREPGNQLLLPDPLVSRRHCRIELNGEQCTLTDLSSANGSFVNGVPVKERVLTHGDLIRLGASVLLFLHGRRAEDGEALAITSGVSFEEAQLAAQNTLSLRREDSRYLQVEQLLSNVPVTARLAREFQVLLRVGLEINSLFGVEALQQRLLELICTVVPAERGAILLRGADNKEFVSAFGWERTAGGGDVQVSRTVVQQVVSKGVALLCNNVPEQAELQAAASLLYAGVQSIIAAPLAIGERVFGVVYLDTSNPLVGFDEAHLQLVTALANLSAAAFDGAQRLERMNAENERWRAEKAFGRTLIGESPALGRVREFIAKVAPTKATVLLYGESGTGKEVVARALHDYSPRANFPFIALNCAALADALLESELFGHEKGAFTGANTLKKGKLELAEGGTVFLDEIGEMKLELQAKLLRVLQERECERVGGTRTIKLNIRVLAATNKDLETAIKDGSFRADLYHRLNVFSVTLPPLRERRTDIELLARFFLDQLVQETGKRIVGFSAAARQCLLSYDWPGNVRELRNAIERAVVLNTTGQILPEDLPESVFEAETPALTPSAQLPADLNPTAPLPGPALLNYRDAIKAARQQIILQAFKQAGGNHQAAAQLLGLHPNNLHREIRLLKLREALKNL